jgi:hypothetical protein
VNFTLPHWHDPFHVSTGLLESDSVLMMATSEDEEMKKGTCRRKRRIHRQFWVFRGRISIIIRCYLGNLGMDALCTSNSKSQYKLVNLKAAIGSIHSTTCQRTILPRFSLLVSRPEAPSTHHRRAVGCRLMESCIT